jgi:NACHT domain
MLSLSLVKPGSARTLTQITGKSILCAHVVKALRNNSDARTLYYFCGNRASGQDDRSQMFRSLAVQLVRQDPALACHMAENYVRQGLPASMDHLRKLLPDLLTAAPFPRIVVDGLDECEPRDHTFLLSQLLSFCNTSTRLANVLVSSRDGGEIGKKLRQKVTLSLRDETQALEHDIKAFVRGTLRSARDEWSFDVSEIAIQRIEQELVRRSNGASQFPNLC